MPTSPETTPAQSRALVDAHAPRESAPRHDSAAPDDIPDIRGHGVVQIPRRRTGIDLAPSVIGGAIVSAFAGWILIVSVAMIGFLATSGNQWMLDTDWNAAMRLGSDAWALSYLVPLSATHVTVSLAPLGMTLIHVVFAVLALRISGRRDWASTIIFPVVYGLTVLVLSAASHGVSNPLMTGIAALVLSAVATAWHLWHGGDLGRWVDRYPTYRRGTADGGWVFLACLGVGVIVTVVGLIRGLSQVLEVQHLLNASTIDLVVVWLAQLTYLPVVAACALAWLAGPGFFTATDALHTPLSAPASAIPAIPVFAIAPTTAIGRWVIVIPIIVGCVVGAVLAWRTRCAPWRDVCERMLTMVVVLALAVTALMWGATGSMGNQRLVGVGPNWYPAALALTAEIVIPMLLIVVLAHERAVDLYRNGWQRLRAVREGHSAAEHDSTAEQENAAEQGNTAEQENTAEQGDTAEQGGTAEQENVAEPGSEVGEEADLDTVRTEDVGTEKVNAGDVDVEDDPAPTGETAEDEGLDQP